LILSKQWGRRKLHVIDIGMEKIWQIAEKRTVKACVMESSFKVGTITVA
jgi:hypothetical protein